MEAKVVGDKSTPSSGPETLHVIDLSDDDSSEEAHPDSPLSPPERVCTPVKFSTILKQAYGDQSAKIRGSIGSPRNFANVEEEENMKVASRVLNGVTAYVEVRRAEDDRSGGFRWMMEKLGATVSKTLNKKVTHVIFQEGLVSTFRKAKELNIHIVSTHWVMACEESLTKVSEEEYPIEKLDQFERARQTKQIIRRPKLMSPDVGTGKYERRLSRRFLAIERKSLDVKSPRAKCGKAAKSHSS